MLGDYVSHIQSDQAMHGRQWDAAPEIYFTWINSVSSQEETLCHGHSPILGLQCHCHVYCPHACTPRGFTVIPQAWDLVIPPPCSKELAEKGMFPST